MTLADDVVWIVEVNLPRARVACFQGLLHGEDGLAVIRCRDPQKQRQQLWTSSCQRDEILAWLAGLPKDLQVEIVEERVWDGETDA